MATKEVMATAPVVVLLYDRTFLAGSFRRALAARWKLYIALAAGWGIVAWTTASTGFRGGTTGFAVAGFTWQSYLLTQSGVILHYLRLVFWPSGQTLAYNWPPAQGLTGIVLPGLAIVGLLAATVWALVKQPPLGFLGAAFFLILAPTSSFIPVQDAAFEHRMYLPLAAVVVLVVIGAWTLGERWPEAKPFLTPALVLALLALTGATIRRNNQYHSEADFWQDALEKNPDSATAKRGLRFVASHDGQLEDKAIAAARDVRARPDNAQARLQLGQLLLDERRTVEAVAELREAQ